MYRLSDDYTEIYDRPLQNVGSDPSPAPDSLTAFWPMHGHQFDGDLFVIGRVTNGWHETWEQAQAAEAIQRRRILERARGHSEKARCPLLWVTERAGTGGYDPRRPNQRQYNTNHSAFWRVIKRISLDGNLDPNRHQTWSSWICWSNLLRIGPKSMEIKPNEQFKRVQLSIGIELIARELVEFSPRRVLVLAGRQWFSPFAKALGIGMNWRDGLVEGVALDGDRRWVVARHPMRKPTGTTEDDFVNEVLAAFARPSTQITADAPKTKPHAKSVGAAKVGATLQRAMPAAKNETARGIPENVKPSPVPKGATFQHVLPWRWGRWHFFNTKVNGKPVGVTVVPTRGGDPAFFPGAFDGEGRRDANVFTRHAEQFWTGWSEDPRTWRNGKYAKDAPFTPHLVPYKPPRKP